MNYLGLNSNCWHSRASLREQLAQPRGGVLGRAEASGAHFGRPEDSSAQVNTERELEFALAARETDALAVVAAALGRIEAGTYGLCIDCGLEIALARLHAAPEAPRCIACQGQAE